MAIGCWWYYFSKFTEFFDTFFFVMRKRYDQVSTLHVIHHGIMPFSGEFRLLIKILFVSNFLNSLNSLVGSKIYSRRTLVLFRFHQYRRSYRYVHLLHASSNGSAHAKIFVVEEISDRLPNDSIHRCHGTCVPAFNLESLSISNCICLVDRNACVHVFLSFQKLLQSSLYKGLFVDPPTLRISVVHKMEANIVDLFLEKGTRRTALGRTETECRT